VARIGLELTAFFLNYSEIRITMRNLDHYEVFKLLKERSEQGFTNIGEIDFAIECLSLLREIIENKHELKSFDLDGDGEGTSRDCI